jgi:hypothetical protein
MKVHKHFRTYLLLCNLVVFLQPLNGFAQSNSDAAKTNQTLKARDGQHDFDFEIGTWRTHLKRLLHPLTGSSTWVEYDGATVVRKVWNGRANLVELEVDGPSGHIEGLSLRLYKPQSHQWSLNFANSSGATLSQPTIGEFKNGRGEFYDQETVNGRAIFVRFVISDITSNSCRFEQAFSDDGGKTWEVNWIATDTRLKDESARQNSAASKTILQPTPTERERQHDFDFEMGHWNIHLKRLLHPLTGSTTWVEFDGTSVTQGVWNGRAELEEFETDSPAGGHIEGLTLRLYNPESRQWSLYWANSKDGTIVAPQIGEFKNGRGEFFGQDTLDGKAIFIRFVWSETTTNSPHFEQSFSDDGGKTWEVNWITNQTPVKD